MSLKIQRDRLRSILLERSVEFGEFTLSSGEKSALYIDARKTTLDPEGARLCAEIFLAEFSKTPLASAIGGPTLGADPIVGAMLALCEDSDPRGFIVRKSEKGHGTRRLIEGGLAEGDIAMMVEDVVTTGGSARRAIEAVRAAGAEVSKVAAVVSRAKTANPFADECIDFFSIFEEKDLLSG